MNPTLSRRRFLESALAFAAVAAGRYRSFAVESNSTPAQAATLDDIPIIDTHIHLFDPTRPQGVPWPDKTNTLIYKPTLPAHYRALAAPLGIRGAIEIECSSWFDDNQWVLDVSAPDSIMVGTIGNLDPGQPAFAGRLENFQKNPLFRGIRYGNLWGNDLTAQLDRPDFVADLKRLADAGLVLDTANPNPRLLAAVVRLSDLIPSLRIVLDHLPSLARPVEAAVRASYDASMKAFADRPQIYAKVSGILHPINGHVSRDLETYRPLLDEIYGTFGPNRVVYGSDWPNSEPSAPYFDVLATARAYFLPKGREAAEKYFWKNSVAAYRWVPRNITQPQLRT